MLKSVLESRGIPVVLLDGDMLREGLNRDLTFSALDRAENIRRAGEVAKILSDAGHTVLAAFITPLESLRAAVRGIFEPDRYVEVFLDCPLSVCERRDSKGLYSRARAGEIPEFTGISSPFERPASSDLVLSTAGQKVEESLASIVTFLESRFSDLTYRGSVSATGRRNGYGRRVAVIGLDSASPSFVFNDAGKDLVNLRALMDHGSWGMVRSTDPPITVPAWTTMTTGKDPGELGLYGFRNRLDRGYGPMVTTNSSHVTARRVWDHLEDVGKTSILLGVPQTYPPKPHRGITVAGFLTPEIDSPFTYPGDLAEELHALAGGEYMTDVTEFRTDDKDKLLADLYAMTEGRFRVASDFLVHRPWDFFMMVEIATDRLHHAFWRHCNSDHPLHESTNAYRHVIADFYKYLDGWLGTLMASLGDETTLIVLSDHGSRSLVGGVRINEWLIRNGLLVLTGDPGKETPLTREMIDWSRTKVWSEGGHYARIFFNVKGREPQGTVDPAEYDSFRAELAEQVRGITDEHGRAMNTRVLAPEDIYRTCNSVPPDLIVYFDDLNRRSMGTVGTGEILTSGNDAGPDDANHDPDGILIITRLADLRSGRKKGDRIENASLLDITPTILHEFGLPVPDRMGGRIINIDRIDNKRISLAPDAASRSPVDAPSPPNAAKGYSPEEEEIIRKRLADLGYI